MTTCEYYPSCSYSSRDDVCLEVPETCKIRNNIKKFRARISGWSLEAEVLEQIDMNGYITNSRWNEGKVL